MYECMHRYSHHLLVSFEGWLGFGFILSSGGSRVSLKDVCPPRILISPPAPRSPPRVSLAVIERVERDVEGVFGVRGGVIVQRE